MIDIQKSRIIIYQNGQREAVVYGDSDIANQYYLVPEPRLVHDADGTPHFSLVRYQQNDGAAGICVFDVELAIDDDARRAAEAELGPDVIWGQLDWLAASVYFQFDIQGQSRMLQASPSLYGDNRATIRVELVNDEELQTFVNAFHGDGSLSSFRVEYDVTTLTMLPAAEATLVYRADIAIAYETQYERYKNTWGQTKQRAVGVKQLLQESGAGDVDVTFHEGTGDETRQRVLDWAWTTLERLVDDAMQTALQMSGGRNPVHYMGGFERNYRERNVVEWTIVSSNPLPRFDDQVWSRVYSVVDSRELVVNFALLGALTGSETRTSVIRDVMVTVDYPTQPTGNTFRLGALDNSSHVFRAPGAFEGGTFVDTYRYRYQVVYAQSGETFESDWITSSDTEINILPADLGIRKVTFIGSNIPFKTSNSAATPLSQLVDKLVIDLFFQRPGGQPNKLESKVMDAKNQTEGVEFESYFNLPLTNEYAYRLIYQMADGSTVVVDPVERFGSQNRDMVFLLNPMLPQTFTLGVMNPASGKEGEAISMVFLNAQYNDPVNPVSGRSHSFQWQGGANSTQPAVWNFLAVRNPGGAYFELDGQIGYGSDFVPINRLQRQAQTSFLFLDPKFEPYSVEVDGSQVDWTKVAQVIVTLFQSEADGPAMAKARMDDLAARARRDRRALAAEDSTVNIVSYTLLKADGSQTDANPRRHYLVRRKRGSANVVYWYGVQYVNTDGTSTYVDDVEVTDRLKIVLPPTASGSEPTFNLRQAEI